MIPVWNVGIPSTHMQGKRFEFSRFLGENIIQLCDVMYTGCDGEKIEYPIKNLDIVCIECSLLLSSLQMSTAIGWLLFFMVVPNLL